MADWGTASAKKGYFCEPTLPWEIISLEMDYPGNAIGDYFQNVLGEDIHRRAQHKMKDNMCMKKSSICKLVREATRGIKGNKLVVYGSGVYHHYTYGLCRQISVEHPDFGYIHIDHHDDYSTEAAELEEDEIFCGTFVKDLLEDTNASGALFIGSSVHGLELVPGKTHGCLLEKHLRTGTGFQKLEKELNLLPDKVYVSMDLDVMNRNIMISAYDQGTLKTKELLRILKTIKGEKDIIGADILGYAGFYNEFPGLDIYAKALDELRKL